MRSHERIRGVLRSPKLIWDVLVKGRYTFTYDQMPVFLNQMPWQQRANLIRAGLNLLHRRPTPWAMPLHMQFELTNYCGLRCPVCPTGIRAVNRRRQAMAPELFERMMSQVGPFLLTMSLWGWGEPLLHPQLERILRSARQSNTAVLLSTNGQNLNDKRVIDAITRQPPAYLILAIDGLTDETNATFRVGARLEPILEGVRKIAEIKQRAGSILPVLNMRFIVMKHNQHQLPELIDFARAGRFDLLTVRTLSTIDAERNDQVHRALLPDNETLRPYRYKNGERVSRSDFICFEPFWFPSVLVDGTLVACEQDYNAKLAMENVSNGSSFAKVWHGGRARRIRRTILKSPADISFCKNCPYRDRPVTDCSIMAHVLNPRIDFASLLRKSAGDRTNHR